MSNYLLFLILIKKKQLKMILREAEQHVIFREGQILFVQRKKNVE